MRFIQSIKTNKNYFLIGLLLLIARIPFFLTRHIQEDAFISWRCAKNIIDFGVYGFNAGERVSASTSHLYVLISAIVYFFSGNIYIVLIPILNSILLISATLIISRSFFQSKNKILIYWILLSIMPISLLISYSGMETSLLILAIAILLKYLHNFSNPKSVHLILFLIPFIRPDATAITIIFLISLFVIEKKINLKFTSSVILGVLVLLALNKIYFNSFLNQTIIAKSSFIKEKSLALIFGNIFKTLKILFLPVGTKYFESYSYFFLAIYIILIIIYIYFELLKKNGKGIPILLLLIGLLIPMIYGIGGAFFPWYFWPSQLTVNGIVLILVMHLLTLHFKFKSILVAFTALILISLIIAQFLLSLNIGTHEHEYRAGIGRYIKSISNASESIMLEPIGYIPYYSERYTHDEIGLASLKVTDYRKLYGSKWWVKYVMHYKPDYLIEREHMINFKTLDDYKFNDSEKIWFKENYELIKHFVYKPEEYTENKFVLSILRLGGHSDYYLYKRNNN
jgi:hypothetical protein